MRNTAEDWSGQMHSQQQGVCQERSGEEWHLDRACRRQSVKSALRKKLWSLVVFPSWRLCLHLLFVSLILRNHFILFIFQFCVACLKHHQHTHSFAVNLLGIFLLYSDMGCGGNLKIAFVNLSSRSFCKRIDPELCTAPSLSVDKDVDDKQSCFYRLIMREVTLEEAGGFTTRHPEGRDTR